MADDFILGLLLLAVYAVVMGAPIIGGTYAYFLVQEQRARRARRRRPTA